MKKTSLNFSNERGFTFKIETIIRRPTGEIEKYKGFVEVEDKKYECHWSGDGTCQSVIGEPRVGGNPIALSSFNIVSEVPFVESDYPTNCSTRSGAWFRLSSVIYNFLGMPVYILGETKINNVNRQTVWQGDGTCQSGQDYDLILIDPYKN